MIVGIMLDTPELHHPEGEMYDAIVEIAPIRRFIPNGNAVKATTLDYLITHMNDERLWIEGDET